MILALPSNAHFSVLEHVLDSSYVQFTLLEIDHTAVNDGRYCSSVRISETCHPSMEISIFYFYNTTHALQGPGSLEVDGYVRRQFLWTR